MTRVICTSEREGVVSRITKGKKYWLDAGSIFVQDDEEYGNIYADEEKKNYIGVMKLSHFSEDYRSIKHGVSLSCFVNTKTSFMLKDIIEWCIKNTPCNALAEAVINYINDNGLNKPENQEKEYVINHVPIYEFAKRNKEAEYNKYGGYDLYGI